MINQKLIDNNSLLEMVDQALALKLAVDFSSSCVNYDPSTMINPTDKYIYANNPGIDTCSSTGVKNAFPQTSPVTPCISVLQQSLCPFYSPDFFILLKASFPSSSLFYYLTRFKSLTGSYHYKIYNSDQIVLFNLDYTNLSNSDKKVDEEAQKVFIEFLDSYIPNYTLNHSVNNLVPEKEEKLSYLSSLIS
jgi:hypothetical protein